MFVHDTPECLQSIGNLPPNLKKYQENQLDRVIKMQNGMKFDDGKLMYSLIEPRFLQALAGVLTHGAKKYAPNNWQKVTPLKQRYKDAMMRHWESYRAGEYIDPESGYPHIAHCACNLMFLMWGEENGN